MKISLSSIKKGLSQKKEFHECSPLVSTSPLILPVLKSNQWAGIKNGFYYRELLKTPMEWSLGLALGYECNERFKFLGQHELEGVNEELFCQQAISQLLKYDVPFEISGKNEEQILFASGREFSSEKILCPEFMLQAHQLLQSENLLVSIPRRRNMVIVSSEAPEKTKMALKNLHRYIWNDDSFGNACIINALVEVEGGRLSRLLPVH